MLIDLVLPYPPTVNTYWRRRGSTYFVSKVGERYRRDVALIVRQQQLKLNLSGRPAIEIIAEPPDKRRRDLDNPEGTTGCTDACGAAHRRRAV